MVPLGSHVTEKLDQLGISPEVLGDRLGRLQRAPINALTHLSAAYAQAAAPRSDRFSAEVHDERVGIAPAWTNPPPSEAMADRGRYIHRTYHRQRVPLHPTARTLDGLDGPRRRGTAMVRRLHRDPILRRSFEHATALQVVRDGRLDGTVSVSAMTASGRSETPLASPALSGNLYDFLGAMDSAILEYAKKLGVYSSSSPDAFFGEGDDLLLYGKGQSYGVPSPSTTGVFGMSRPGAQHQNHQGSEFPAPETGDQAQGVDTHVMQLKRMMDKRSQMYDIVRTVFDKYHQAASTAIGNMKA